MSKEYRHVALMIGDVRWRRWTTGRKLQIIEESYAPGETVSSAARRDEGHFEYQSYKAPSAARYILEALTITYETCRVPERPISLELADDPALPRAFGE